MEIIVAVLLFGIITVLFLWFIENDSEDHGRRNWSGAYPARKEWVILDPAKRAGRNAEKKITNAIRSALYDDDILLTNISVTQQGRETELDNVIINSYGVFIIEAKYYSGRLEGNEGNFEWTKYHTSEGENTYIKTVKNPIKQVRRQIDILANYLRDNGVNVWVEGYVIMLENNSPVESSHILKNIEEVRRVLHNSDKQRLTQRTKERIVELLSRE